jgi:hypothetical protein
MSSALLLQSRRHDRPVIDRPEINRGSPEPLERIITMLRKIAGALLAATLLTAPAFAQDMSKNPAPPAAVATQPIKSDVKADAKTSVNSDLKANVKTNKGKHARRHVRTHHIVKHSKPVKVVKHGKGLKLAKHSKSVKSVKAVNAVKQVKRVRTSTPINTQTSTKSMTKTGAN